MEKTLNIDLDFSSLLSHEFEENTIQEPFQEQKTSFEAYEQAHVEVATDEQISLSYLQELIDKGDAATILSLLKQEKAILLSDEYIDVLIEKQKALKDDIAVLVTSILGGIGYLKSLFNLEKSLPEYFVRDENDKLVPNLKAIQSDFAWKPLFAIYFANEEATPANMRPIANTIAFALGASPSKKEIKRIKEQGLVPALEEIPLFKKLVQLIEASYNNASHSIPASEFKEVMDKYSPNFFGELTGIASKFSNILGEK